MKIADQITLVLGGLVLGAGWTLVGVGFYFREPMTGILILFVGSLTMSTAFWFAE